MFCCTQVTQERATSSTERFFVSQDLIGLAIGKDGGNISAARKIPGVTDIILDEETHYFTVYGETDVAVMRARELLEFKDEEYLVPRHLVGKCVCARVCMRVLFHGTVRCMKVIKRSCYYGLFKR